MGKISSICACRYVLFFFLFAIIPSTQTVQAQTPRIVFSVPDVEINRGDTVFLDVVLDNFQDTIAGFQFQLKSTRPDLVRFKTQTVPNIDTIGTLVGGFEYIQVIDSSFVGDQYWFRCIANVFGFDGINERGFGPQQGGIALRIPVIVNPFPDLTDGRMSEIIIVEPFDFSDPNANSIGVVTETIFDTIFYECTAWAGSACLNWLELPDGDNGYDSMYAYTYPLGHLDTTVVVPVHGSVTIIENMCDNNLDGEVNVADLTCLVSYLWSATGDGCPDIYCNTNEIPYPDVGDLTVLVSYLFRGGAKP